MSDRVVTIGTDAQLRIAPDDIGWHDGNGSVPTANADYVTAEEFGHGNYHRTRLTLDALPITTVDNGTAGHGGGSHIYDFPQGYVHVHVGSLKLDATADGTGILLDSVIDVGVGSVVATSVAETLSGTHEDIINKADLSFSNDVTLVDQFAAEVTGGGIDGTATAVNAYLNVAGTATTCDAAGQVLLSGTIEIQWHNLGYAGDA